MFREKNDIFHISAQNGEAVLTSTHNLCLEQKYENNVHVYPYLLYKKLGLMESNLYRHVFVMSKCIRIINRYFFIVSIFCFSTCSFSEDFLNTRDIYSLNLPVTE